MHRKVKLCDVLRELLGLYTINFNAEIKACSTQRCIKHIVCMNIQINK